MAHCVIRSLVQLRRCCVVVLAVLQPDSWATLVPMDLHTTWVLVQLHVATQSSFLERFTVFLSQHAASSDNALSSIPEEATNHDVMISGSRVVDLLSDGPTTLDHVTVFLRCRLGRALQHRSPIEAHLAKVDPRHTWATDLAHLSVADSTSHATCMTPCHTCHIHHGVHGPFRTWSLRTLDSRPLESSDLGLSRIDHLSWVEVRRHDCLLVDEMLSAVRDMPKTRYTTSDFTSYSLSLSLHLFLSLLFATTFLNSNVPSLLLIPELLLKNLYLCPQAFLCLLVLRASVLQTFNLFL